jgi:SAM-dependent methyltransferase
MRLATRRQQPPSKVARLWQTDLKIVLHVGCGPRIPDQLPSELSSPEWQEIRLDIEPAVDPDIVASIVDMPIVETASVDAIWSSHNLEHVFAHEVPLTLREFRRVLRPSGVAHVQVPDVLVPARAVARGQLETELYRSPAGPITALDMLFGYGPAIARGEHFMAHRTAFTKHSLTKKFQDAGFSRVRVEARQQALWATATK